MTRRNLHGRLELTWMGKDQALIPTDTNTYDYTWVDRNDPRFCQTHYLIHEGHVGNTDDGGIHDNLLITGESGDVLEALTRVPELAEKYVGRIKCIYIDPPFNTAKSFEQYEDNLEHSIWLTLMRDRLEHLQKLLTDDGSIWVHLDHSEVHRMRLLLDEVFGPKKFIAEIAWEKVAGRDNRSIFSKTIDFILVYAKTADGFKSARNLLPRNATDTATAYTNPDNDPRGLWTSGDFTAQYNPADNPREDQLYTLVTPMGLELEPSQGTCWRYTERRYRELLADNRVWFGDDGKNSPRLKRFLSEVQDGLVPKTLWPHSEVGTNDSAKKEIQTLFPDASPFATPKPEKLLERILQIATVPGDTVLDCFAGSGTTAAVAHKMGRRWVICELQPETVAKYTRPRLEKVVEGSDPGGVTTKVGYEPAVRLPGSTTVEEARAFNTMLNRVKKALVQGDEDPASVDELEPATLDPATIAAINVALKGLKELTKTKKVAVQQWRGGGGFDLARISPDWVGVDVDEATGEGYAYITADATGEVLNKSIAAHLGFSITPEDPRFVGVKGRQRLAVVEGVLTEAKVDELVEALPDGNSVMIVCDGAPEGLSRTLQKRAKGSRLRVMPEDLFSYNVGQGF